MLRKTVTLRAIALTTGLMGSAELVKAQGAEAEPAPPAASTAANLPPLEVTAKAKKKTKKAAAKSVPKAPPPPTTLQAAAEPAPVKATAAFPASGVSGPSTPGAQQINVTSQDLARNNPSDVRGVFKGEPGVSVGSSIPMSQKVYVHGIEETNLSVTVDGAQQNNKVFHHNSTNVVDPGLLKAVRVDAGVAPADAGFGALAGSIAYETKDVGDLMVGDGVGGFSKSMFNTNGNVFTNYAAAYGKVRGFEALGYFSIGDGDDFENGRGDVVRGTETDFVSGLGKLAYQAPSGDRFEISHEQMKDDAIRPFRPNAGFIDTGRPWEPRVRPYELKRQSTVFNYSDATPTTVWDPEIVIAYSKTEVTVPVYTRLEQYIASGESDTFNGKAQNTFVIPFGSLVTGFDFANRTAVLDDPYEPSEEESDQIGAFVQARVEPFTGTRLSFGGRGDHQRFTGTTGEVWDDSGFSGNVSGEQDLVGDLLTAKAGYSHVWAGVPLAENFIMNPAWDYEDGPQSVTADNVTAGLRLRHRGFSLEGTVFRTEIDNARVAAYANRELGAIRTRDIDSRGFEIGVGYDWGTGFVRVKYAHIDVDIDGQPADSDTGNYVATPVGDIIILTAAHRFQRLGLTVGGDIEIAPEYDRVAPPAITFEESPPYPAYEVINLFAEYEPKNWIYDVTFRVDVRNLFDELYSNRATYGNEFGNVTPLYEPGRSFQFTSTARF